MSLVNYSSSSESNTDDEFEEKPLKRFKNTGDENVEKIKHKLPVPNCLKQPKQKCLDDIVIDNPNDHDGKIRNFEHVRGNWTSFVYINVNKSLEELQTEIRQKFVELVDLKCSSDIHISLSKTLVLRHHWIETFSNSILQLFKSQARFQLRFGSLNIYTNEEKTRTFIGLTVDKINAFKLKKFTDQIDQILEEFRLDKFYSNPLFHASILWCIGDCTSLLVEKHCELQAIFNKFLEEQPLDYFDVDVERVNIKIGNKYCGYTLKS